MPETLTTPTTITREEAQLRAAMLEVGSYRLHFDLTNPSTFRVHAVINFTVSDAALGQGTWIDLLGHDVETARLNGTNVVCDGARLCLKNLAANNELVVTSHAPFSTTGEGLHRTVDPFDEAEYIYSQCEPADARRIFPVFEQPDLKAVFEVSVTAPAHWEVIANTPGKKILAQDVARWTFDATPQMSSYLFALIAGEYVQVGSDTFDGTQATVPLGVWARRSLAKYVDAKNILALTKTGLNFYETQFDTPYPFTKYDQIFVPEFNAGAMENIGAVTISEDYVFRSPMPQAVVERRATTILHELAHMWFGNLVTMRWWDDLWLNESFAEFVSHLAAINAGYLDAWTTFNTTEKTWAYRQDQLSTTHPIVSDMVDLEAVAANFDGITYAKGAAALRQLVALVGTETFMAAIRTYFDEFAWSNTTFTDLLQHIQQASGRDLSGWAQQWLHSSGVNTLKWRRRNGVTIIQSLPIRQQKVGVGAYDFHENKLIQTHYVETDLNAEVTTVEIPTAPLILVNDGDLSFAKLRPDAVSLATLTDHLSDTEDSLTRSLLWGAAWDMTRDAEISASWFLKLVTTHIGAETHSSVVFTVLRQATETLERFIPSAFVSDYRQDFATKLWDLAQQAIPGSDIQLQLIQTFLRHARTDETTIVAALAAKHGPTGFHVSTDMAWTALQRLVAVGAAEQSTIDAMEQDDGSFAGQLAALQARAMLPTVQAKVTAWEVMTSGNPSNLELRHMVMGFSDVHDYALLAPYVTKYFETIDHLWATHSFEIAETLATGLFPMWAITQQTASRTLAIINSTPHSGLKRVLTELHDDVERALLARHAFSSD